ncbi:CHASE2 domain-containing protein, partial [bacterium]|nr:CHASE2 domain-containing protein [bacterium]
MPLTAQRIDIKKPTSMRKIFAALFNLFQARSRGRVSLVQRLLYTKGIGLSLAAHYARRSGAQAILVVAILATGYAGYLYVDSIFSPGGPKPSHDVILKSRFSSPAPAKNIVILDIDERSLAAMSDSHGRWPWPRDVLADGLQKLSDLQVRSVLFNVMLSDPDKNNPDADAAMDLTAMLMRPVAFPLIRLNPKNDADSRLLVAQIPGVELAPKHLPGTTLAAILPLFGSMHDRLGVANQQPDADGIVRQYPLRWKEATYTLPSSVQRTLELAGGSVAQLPPTLALNWRNKQGRYQRVSFSDLLLGQLSAADSAVFKDAYVVLSVSAPGLGQTKATSVAPVEDDGEILATALDDALNDSYLRTLPDALALVINLVTIWSLVWLSNRRPLSSVMNQAFFVLQSCLVGITLLSASYTHYLIDLSDSMSFGLA